MGLPLGVGYTPPVSPWSGAPERKKPDHWRSIQLRKSETHYSHRTIPYYEGKSRGWEFTMPFLVTSLVSHGVMNVSSKCIWVYYGGSSPPPPPHVSYSSSPTLHAYLTFFLVLNSGGWESGVLSKIFTSDLVRGFAEVKPQALKMFSSPPDYHMCCYNLICERQQGGFQIGLLTSKWFDPYFKLSDMFVEDAPSGVQDPSAPTWFGMRGVTEGQRPFKEGRELLVREKREVYKWKQKSRGKVADNTVRPAER